MSVSQLKESSPEERRCSQCGETKLLYEFSQNGPYIRSYCKKCANSNNRIYKYKHRYGIEYWEFEKILEKQNYKCKICDKELTVFTAHTDHDHETRKIRGLLCGNCNTLLGLAHDSINILLKAAEYLCQD